MSLLSMYTEKFPQVKLVIRSYLPGSFKSIGKKREFNFEQSGMLGVI